MLFALYYMCDYSIERRRPGTAAEPEVTLSTWDAYGQGRAQGPGQGRARDQGTRVGSQRYRPRPRGRHGRVCLV